MLNCWKESPNDRPTFTEICAELMKLLETTNVQYNYVDAIRNIEIELELLGSEDEVAV